jgi:hypothetical protein
LIELLAAIAGGVIGYVGRLLLDIRHERGELRTARDLTRSDLTDALGAIDRASTSGWPIGTRHDWVQPWKERRASLASGLPDGDSYDTVARAFARMHELENALNTPRPPDHLALTSRDKEFLRDMKALIEPAVAALGRSH